MIRVAYTLRRNDGTEQQEERDLLNRGDSVTVLLSHPTRGTVLLVRQPRIVTTLRGSESGETIEACRGHVHKEQPLACAFRECDEELGHRPKTLDLLASIYPCVGSSLELCHIYLGEYGEHTKVHGGGGLRSEGEDIEVLEVPFDVALSWVKAGAITDSGTVIALQSVALAKSQDGCAAILPQA